MQQSTAIVVDDSRLMRKALGAMLERAGCAVVAEGADGDDVVQLYERHTPTLTVVDLVMPSRDGLTAAKDLLARHPTALIVVCSSIASAEKEAICRRAGVAHYLIKPFQADRAAAMMKFVLSRFADRP